MPEASRNSLTCFPNFCLRGVFTPRTLNQCILKCHALIDTCGFSDMRSISMRGKLKMVHKMKSLRGFTLVEMAIVLVLFGIAMSMGLKMVTANLDNAAYSATKSKQERIKLALIGYLRTYGRLPCPDYVVATVATGAEATPSCNAAPTDGYGIVPWQTLGIPRDAAQDGWGNYFTYRVANGTAGSKNWTSKTVGTPFDINELTTSTDALTIQELNAAGTALVSTSSKAVAIILSHGKNGFGAKTVKVAARIPATTAVGAGTDEITNATSGITTFVRRPVTEDPATVGGAYDDVVTYMTPQDLLQPLVTEGTLKTCKAYCPIYPQVLSCSTGSLRCTDSHASYYCAGSGPACTSDTIYCTSGGTPQCLPASLAGCSATGTPVGNPSPTCP